MSIAFGATDISKIYLGNDSVSKIYLGNDLVFGGNQMVQIDYIEADGTQWVDTGVYFDIGLSVEVTAVYTGNFSSTQILVCSHQNAGCWCGNSTYNGGSFGLGTGSSNCVGASNVVTTMTMTYNSGTTYLDANGVTASRSRSNNSTSNTMKLFGNGSAYFSHARIYSCRMEYNGLTILNLLPVRIGSVGYFYDTMQGTLFGNDGSGDFILGADS